MEGEMDYRPWDELIPDALGLIFSKLCLQDILTVVPRVCKSWNRTVLGPYCWQEIDIEEWSEQCLPDQLDRMLEMLITRSSGSLRKLSVTCFRNEAMFPFLADHARSLQTLRLPRSSLNDTIVEQIAGRLSMITFLDLSYCSKIGAGALEVLGTKCKSLVGLCRNMHPLDEADKEAQEKEARAIATTMPKLKHLEMAYHLIGTENALKILSSCTDLEFMDLRGCWDVELDDKLLQEKFPKLKVLGPFVMDYYYEMDNLDDECYEYSDASSWEFDAGSMGSFDGYEYASSDEMWDDERRLEELELRFYEGIEDAGLHGWPASP
ncbi:F-box protein FBW2 [Linum grandiflorum]